MEYKNVFGGNLLLTTIYYFITYCKYRGIFARTTRYIMISVIFNLLSKHYYIIKRVIVKNIYYCFIKRMKKTKL